MSKIEDGGPAFPVPTDDMPDANGMSLRDWFAGQALASDHVRSGGLQEWEITAMFGKHRTGIRREEIIAAEAYRIADAMLAARKALPMTDHEELAKRLEDAYAKVSAWPENRMAPGAVEALGQGFMDLLVVRNLAEDAAAALRSQAAEIKRLREARSATRAEAFEEAAKVVDTMRDKVIGHTWLYGDMPMMEAKERAYANAAATLRSLKDKTDEGQD